MNLELMKGGYPLAIIQADQRKDYYANLGLVATNGDYAPFVKQICDILEQGFKPYSIALGYELGVKPTNPGQIQSSAPNKKPSPSW
jgi:hypothetical protein